MNIARTMALATGSRQARARPRPRAPGFHGRGAQRRAFACLSPSTKIRDGGAIRRETLRRIAWPALGAAHRFRVGSHLDPRSQRATMRVIQSAACGVLLAVVLSLAGCGSSDSAGKHPHDHVQKRRDERSGDPVRYTCDGSDTTPPLEWGEVPAGTGTLVLFVVGVIPTTKSYALSVEWAVAGIDPALHMVEAGRLPAGRTSVRPPTASAATRSARRRERRGSTSSNCTRCRRPTRSSRDSAGGPVLLKLGAQRHTGDRARRFHHRVQARVEGAGRACAMSERGIEASTVRARARALLAIVVLAALLASLAGCGSSSSATVAAILVRSRAVAGEVLAARYTCDGQDVSPPLAWGAVPADVKQLALFVVGFPTKAGTKDVQGLGSVSRMGCRGPRTRACTGSPPASCRPERMRASAAPSARATRCARPRARACTTSSNSTACLPPSSSARASRARPTLATLNDASGSTRANAHGGFPPSTHAVAPARNVRIDRGAA